MRWGLQIIFIFLMTVFSLRAWSIQSADAIGTWKYVAYLYQGRTNPLPNPALELLLKFETNGTMTISWTRKDDPGFCESKSTFQITNDQLVSTVTETNPRNTMDCAQDPDMQVGKKSTNPIELRNRQLFLNIGLSGEDFYYIFDRL